MYIPEIIPYLFSLSRGQHPWAMWPFGPGLEGGWLLSLSKLVFIALVLAFLALLLRWAFGPKGLFRGNRQESREKALKALDMRLAQGEITPEEYTQRKRALLKE